MGMTVLAMGVAFDASVEKADLPESVYIAPELAENVIVDESVLSGRNAPDMGNGIAVKNTADKDYLPNQVGKITIPGTETTYDLMLGAEYLRADAHGNYDYAGMPFVDAASGDSGENMIIYAHNMKDGSMFAPLLNYKNEAYWMQNPIVEMEVGGEREAYRIFAAFNDVVHFSNEQVFKFYEFTGAQSTAEYDEAIRYFKSHTPYETGIAPVFGNDLVTLVTCDRSYGGKRGRFVVVAVRMTDGEQNLAMAQGNPGR